MPNFTDGPGKAIEQTEVKSSPLRSDAMLLFRLALVFFLFFAYDSYGQRSSSDTQETADKLKQLQPLIATRTNYTVKCKGKRDGWSEVTMHSQLDSFIGSTVHFTTWKNETWEPDGRYAPGGGGYFYEELQIDLADFKMGSVTVEKEELCSHEGFALTVTAPSPSILVHSVHHITRWYIGNRSEKLHTFQNTGDESDEQVRRDKLEIFFDYEPSAQDAARAFREAIASTLPLGERAEAMQEASRLQSTFKNERANEEARVDEMGGDRWLRTVLSDSLPENKIGDCNKAKWQWQQAVNTSHDSVLIARVQAKLSDHADVRCSPRETANPSPARGPADATGRPRETSITLELLGDTPSQSLPTTKDATGRPRETSITLELLGDTPSQSLPATKDASVRPSDEPKTGCCCLLKDEGPPMLWDCAGYKDGDLVTENRCKRDADDASTKYKWHEGKCTKRD
jgi:hypothetical protein